MLSATTGADPLTRIIMLGTGDFALPTFLALLDAGEAVVALVTQPDRPQGRKQELIPSRIKRAALDRGVPVEQPEDVNDPPAVEHLKTYRPDLLVTAAYGQILSAALLSVPTLGGINLHGSILPSYRGAAPVARAIADGLDETGVTVIKMSPKIDAGGMIAFARTPIGPDETAGEVEARLAAIGAPLIVGCVGRVAGGTAQILPQDRARITRAPKLRKEDAPIDWSKAARAVHDHVRALQPWPIASTAWTPADPSRPPIRLIVHRSAIDAGQGEPGVVVEAAGDRLVVAAGSGAVRLLSVQVPGRKALPAEEFLRGNPVRVGDRLGG